MSAAARSRTLKPNPDVEDEELNAYRDVLKAEGWQEQPCDYWISPNGIRMTLVQAAEAIRHRPGAACPAEPAATGATAA